MRKKAKETARAKREQEKKAKDEEFQRRLDEFDKANNTCMNCKNQLIDSKYIELEMDQGDSSEDETSKKKRFKFLFAVDKQHISIVNFSDNFR